MEKPLPYYNRLSILAVLVFALLVSLQVLWVVKAVEFEERATLHQLKQLVGNVGIGVNGIDHAAFHGDSTALSAVSTDSISAKIEDYLADQGIQEETYFALYQDSTEGIFRSDAPEFREELLDSEIRTCMSCIVSFWTMSKPDSSEVDLENPDPEQLRRESEFQYYSPVNELKKKSGKTVWLSLYQPNSMSAAIRSMVHLFVLNLVLLLVLLALFRHLLRSFSKHKQLSKVKNDFFNNMTHEFKTPISSIRLASRVLRAEQNPEKRSTYNDLIEKESKSLELQIDKLLELSLLEHNEIQLKKEPLDLCELFQEIPQKLKLLLEDKSGTLHLNCEVQQSPFSGDSYHLLNSFCNLVENSLKHSPPGTHIWVQVQPLEKGIRISVKDNGPGIQEADRPKIFSRFYRGKPNGLAKGAGFGIGLSYVRSIIEGHDGKITLNSAYTEGTEFIIQL